MFVLGLVSSLHCVQMCGPLVLAYSVPMAARARREIWTSHACYNLGRIATYTLLGAVAGAAGSAFTGSAGAARVVAGASMIVAGVLLSGALKKGSLVRVERLGITRALSRAAGALFKAPGARSRLVLGLVLGFLPCGLVYAALLRAVGAGSAAGGALTMMAFGLGTMFALLGAGVASSVLGRRLGRWSNALAGLSVAFMGAWLVWRGLAGQACHG